MIGLGTMGSGIAYLCAYKGYQVAVREVDQKLLKRGKVRIKRMIVDGVNRGKLAPEEGMNVLKRIKGTTNIFDAIRNVDIVIESVPENLSLKKKVFRQLDEGCPTNTILTSNTSALSVSEIGLATKRPDKVIGLHFFNPPYVMRLVEIIMGNQTSPETCKTAKDFVFSLDKEAVIVKDKPGFIVNRVLNVALGEAILLLQEGIASAEDIDRALILGLNWPMGLLKLADFLGLDAVLDVCRIMHQAMGEKYKPPSVLEEKVEAGHLGMKTRKGFHEYRL